MNYSCLLAESFAHQDWIAKLEAELFNGMFKHVKIPFSRSQKRHDQVVYDLTFTVIS